MGVFSFLRRMFVKPKAGEAPPPESKSPRLLREFVYLDEVSLQSLLASQKGAITAQISNETSEATEAEVNSNIKGTVPTIIETELGSRIQAQSANSTQISRKATVQSWFGELHSLSELRLISTVEPSAKIVPLKNLDALGDVETESTVLDVEKLTRGALLEMRVVLTADPIFTLKTLITEFSTMLGEAPEIFNDTDGLEDFDQAEPANIILKKFLAGLIPIRCRALDHVVISYNSRDYIVHVDAIKELDIETRPLDVVGVTDHSLYWKDIRRVLFSDAAFTVLARVGRDGTYDSWNPVKLSQIFKGIVPSIVDDISSVSLTALGAANKKPEGAFQSEVNLETALNLYGEALVKLKNKNLTKKLGLSVQEITSELKGRWHTVSDQNSAFQEMKSRLSAITEIAIEPSHDLELRKLARSKSGLSMFPTKDRVQDEKKSDESDNYVTVPELSHANDLIDVEFVAIYW